MQKKLDIRRQRRTLESESTKEEKPPSASGGVGSPSVGAVRSQAALAKASSSSPSHKAVRTTKSAPTKNARTPADQAIHQQVFIVLKSSCLKLNAFYNVANPFIRI